MIRVAIADDQELVRAGLRMILEGEADFQVVGEAADGEERRLSSLGASSRTCSCSTFVCPGWMDSQPPNASSAMDRTNTSAC
jgi:hypothetical protein